MVNVNANPKCPTTWSENEKKIASIFLSNGISSTVIIPIELARKYHINRPSHVTIEDTENGILIKKLEVK
jgi:hypothetical protein